jgi:uncharacterized repeat protein (TIGR01451 family)
MSSVRKLYGFYERSDGRIRLMTLLGVSGLVAALALLLMVPAFAGAGDPSGLEVQPTEVSYGGGSGACAVYSPGTDYELHINNPLDGTYTGPDGTEVTIDVGPDDFYFDFTFDNNPEIYAFDVIVNGGSNNTHYDYGGSSVGAVRADTSLHAPTKGGSSNLYKLSHINICYEVNPVADLSVEKVPLPEPAEGESFVADVGDEVDFAITVGNAGPLDATGVIVTDTLPTGMTFVSASDSGSNSNGTVTWTGLSIPSGGSKTLSLTVTITDEAAGQDVYNGVSVEGDQPDPNGNNDSANSVPPVTVTADISGVKYHDHDTDGSLDPTEEEPLSGWTITAFDAEGNVAGSADTNVDGLYTITDLQPGTYTVCEATNTSGLPGSGDGYSWSWTQSEPSGNSLCAGYANQEPAGHSVTVDGDVTGVDFGNHIQVGINCSDGDVTLNLGGTGTADNPYATVVVPQDTPSCSGANAPWLVTFDLGRSDDADTTDDEFSQFVVFGDGVTPTDENATITIQVVWDAEPADYEPNNELVVPTTQVSFPDLADINNLTDVVRCNTDTDLPTTTTPVCLDSRTIEEGGDLGTDIQVTENFVFLGDPGYFR